MKLALVLLIALAGTAAAQDATTKKQANAHFKQGKAFYDAKQWDRAIAEYEAAWALIPQPLLQFNIALALDQKGDLEEALAHFQKYLELDPSGAVADEAREDVARLTPKVERLRADREAARIAEEQRVAAEAAEAERIRLEAEQRAADERQHALDAEARRVERERQAQAEEAALRREAARRNAAPHRARARVLTISGLVAVGAGAIAGGVAAYSGIDAKASSDALTDHTFDPWNSGLLDEQRHGRDAQQRMWIFAGVGGALGVGGAVLLWLGRSAGHRADQLELTAGPGTGLGVVGAF